MTEKSTFSIRIKGLAIFLAVLMSISLFPMNVFAEWVTSIAQEKTVAAEITYPFELVELREADTKYYQLENGKKMVARYPQAVHYLDAEGNWQEIDNTLAVSGGMYASADARIKLAKKTNGSATLLSLHEGNRKLEMGLANAAKKVEGQVTNLTAAEDGNATELQKMTTLAGLNAKILYAEILEGVDLEYVLSGSRIKENLIIKAPRESYAFTFNLKLNNLTATMGEEGEILLSDSKTGETAYVIPAGFAVDADGAHTDAVTYALTDFENGSYLLTVSVDEAYMNAQDRTFPVTVDPPIYTGYNSSVSDAFSDGPSNQFLSTYDYLQASPYNSIYWKMTSLPTLPNDAYVFDAQISLVTKAVDLPSGVNSRPVGVYETFADWTTATPSGVSNSTNYTDCVLVNSTLEATYTWNVTPLVKKWYDGFNYGLCVAIEGTTSGTYIQFHSNEATDSSVRPQLCITYAEIKGLEDYWSYSAQDAGFAGSGAVNNATGALTFAIPTLTTTDGLMPFTPTLYYNSVMAGRENIFANVEIARSTSIDPTGFQTNFNETVIKSRYAADDDRTVYYTFMDGDGTVHYFTEQNDAGEYVDQDGLHLTLIEEDYLLKIIDVDGNIRYFYSATLDEPDTNASAELQQRHDLVEACWTLAAIDNNAENSLFFDEYFDEYERYISITLSPRSSYNHLTQLAIYYTSSNRPYLVLNPNSGEAVVLRYSATATGSISASNEKYLRQVIRAHGSTSVDTWLSYYNSNASTSAGSITVDATADYTYDASGYLTSVSNNLSLYQLHYTYTGGKVTGIVESVGASSTTGQQISLTYGTSYTEIRDSGSDDCFGTSDDLLSRYVFDDNGRVISFYTTDLAQNNLFGAANAIYEPESARSDNSIKTSISTTQHSSNYLLNGGFEQVTGGNIAYWGGSGISPIADSYEGAYGASLTYLNTTLSQSVYLTPGEYSLSLYVKTQNRKNCSITLGAAGTSQRISLNETTLIEDYVFAGMNFTVSSAGTVTVSIACKRETSSGGSTGPIYLDNVMLSKTSGVAEFDMVQMGHFESSSSTVTPATYWKDAANASAALTFENVDTLHGTALKLATSTEVTQTVFEVSDAAYGFLSSDTFTVTGWGKGTAQSYNSNALFGITLRAYSSSFGWESLYIPFDKSIEDWQFAGGVFRVTSGYGMITKLTVTLHYTGHAGTGYFDGISVVRNSTNANVYTYHEGNGLLASAYNGKSEDYYYYDTQNRPVLVLTGGCDMVEYTYDSVIPKLVKTEVHSVYSGSVSNLEIEYMRYAYSYTYNGNGQMTEALMSDSLENISQSYIAMRYSYITDDTSHIVGLLSSETVDGKTTHYFYDDDNGRLLAVTAPDGKGVCYTYDGMGNLTAVNHATYNASATNGYVQTSGVSTSVSYSYDAATKRLSAISTSSTTYRFTYDIYGNTTMIGVSDTETSTVRQLASYTYNPYNGKLNTLSYGNGYKEKYIYDELDRLVEIKYTTSTTYTTAVKYVYDSAGRLHRIEDALSGEATVYQYDALGRVIGSYNYATDDYYNRFVMSAAYSGTDRLTELTYSWAYYLDSVNSDVVDAISYEYSYNDLDLPRKVCVDGQEMVTLTYDPLSRLANKTVSYSGFTLSQGYAYGANTNEQYNRVAEYSWAVNNGTATTYVYTYDDNGNITLVTNKATGATLERYTYDALGQLTRADIAAVNTTYVYQYDAAGNRTVKREYPLSFTSYLGTQKDVHGANYYDNTFSKWDDRLARADLQYTEYDWIGNLTQIGDYGDGGDTPGKQFVWQGRLLMEYIELGDFEGETLGTVTFTYNSDGIRTSKFSSGETHRYILDGTRVVAEELSEDMVLLVYIYDESGSPIGMKYQGPTYAADQFDYFFFQKNLLGDIVGIYNASGTLIGSYIYGPWGEVLDVVTYDGNTTLQNRIVEDYNPFRYRGYFYDWETGLYYLQSRYYNPEWGRFINADSYVSTGQGLLGYNMFAYCGNNPVNRVDPTGDAWWAIVVGIVAIVAIIAADHYLGKNHPGGVQLIPDENDNNMKDKILYAEGNGFNASEDSLTLLDFEAGIYSGIAKYKNGEMSLATFLNVCATAQFDFSQTGGELDISAMATIYKMYGEHTLTIAGYNITVSGALNVGAVGGGINYDKESMSFGFAPPSAGIIPSFKIDIDPRN